MMTTMYGVIHGRTIELDREPGWPDGETVAVTIQQAMAPESASKPSGIPDVEQWADRLVFDSSVLLGQRIVRGTRLGADTLVTELQRGQSDEDLLRDHPELTREDVNALRHYARTPVGIRRSFGGWAEDADELDGFLEWNRQRRKLSRRELEP
jgi:uncharacterized protein (DUF433 family)